MHTGYYHYLRLFFFIFLLGWYQVLWAHAEPNYIQLTRQQGLQSNHIYNTHVARNGLLYIAHAKGLSSFDGSVFKHYFNTLLPFTEVTTIMESDDGTIFCKAFNNNVFKVWNDSLVKVKWFPNQNGFSPSTLYKNKLISLSNDSVIFYNTTTNKQQGIAVRSVTSTGIPKQIVFGGIVKRSNQFQILLVDTMMQCSLLDPSLFGMTHFSSGELFLATDKQVDKIYHVNQQKALPLLPDANNTVVNYITQIDQEIWVCTTDGLYKVSPNGRVDSKHLTYTN